MTSSQQSWASGDLRAGGRARVGGGLCAGSLRRAPASVMWGPIRQEGAWSKAPTGPRLWASPRWWQAGWAGAPGVWGPLHQPRWCRMGVAAGRVAGKSHSCGHKRKHFSGASQQANHFRAALQPTPLPRAPLGRPADVRAAALSTLLLALEVSPSWTGFMDGNLRVHHLPTPSSPRAPLGYSSDGHPRSV